MFRDSNQKPQTVSAGTVGGVDFVSAKRAGDATHAVFLMNEPSGNPWGSDNVSVINFGFYDARNLDVRVGRDSSRPSYDSFQGGTTGFLGFSMTPLGFGSVEIISNTTSSMGPAAFVVPFGQYDEVRAYIEAQGASAQDVEVRTMLAELTIGDLADGSYYTSHIEAMNAGRVLNLSGDASVGLALAIGSEAGNNVPFTLGFNGDVTGAITGDATMAAMVTLVISGSNLANASSYNLLSNDGGSSTVSSIGSSGRGAYIVTPDSSTGIASLKVNDVSGGTTQNLDLSAALVDVGAQTLNIDRTRVLVSGTIPFT